VRGCYGWCYLPPGRADIPALTPAKLVFDSAALEGCKAECCGAQTLMNARLLRLTVVTAVSTLTAAMSVPVHLATAYQPPTHTAAQVTRAVRIAAL